MATNHHPHADVLWAYAAGNLDEASSVLVATHMALCPACRRDVVAMEEAGGTMFEAVETAPVSTGSFERLMARIDADNVNDRLPENVERFDPARKSSKSDAVVPRPLRDYLGSDLDG
ncbi:MAG: zf-HC2 domain-containing protein, partial [Rhodobacteraceae bacterium]|nr:zf-HC2 domain-containing protein [Paracoccaceae bacterium]